MAARHSTSTPAVGYARRSTDLQERSIPDQKACVEQWAAENGYEIIRWYVDDAISGTSTRKRDDFARMFDAAENGRDFDAVLCYDVSRFSRGGTNETGYYVHRLRLAGVAVHFTADGIPEGDEGELIQGVKSWQARQYSVKLSRDVIRGHMSSLIGTKSRQGGRAPYGYDQQYVTQDGRVLRTIRRLTDGTKQEYDPDGRLLRVLASNESPGKAKSDVVRLVPGDPEHVAVVQRIFRRYLEGVGFKSIAIELNADGIPGPSGGPWRFTGVKDILRHPAYTGAMVWNRGSAGKIHAVGAEGRPEPLGAAKRVHRKPEDQWVVIEDVHEALVDREDFDRVQAEMTRRREMGGQARPRQRYLLSGLVKCLRCGYNFLGRKLGRPNRRYRYYIDGGNHRGGKTVCAHRQIPAEALERWVVGQVRQRILGDAKTVDAAVSAFVKAVRSQQREPDRDASAERELAAVGKRIKATAGMLADPALADVDEIRETLIGLKARRDALQARVGRKRSTRAVLDATTIRRWAEERLAMLDEALATSDASVESRRLVAAFVDRIEIEPEGKRGTLFVIADPADVLFAEDSTRVGNGERTRMVYAFPTNERLWDEYARLRAEGLRAGDGGAAATEFYREHRESMDEGAKVAWPERHNHDELSAIQHAINLRLQDEAAFYAEYQNEPLPAETAEDDTLSADQVAAKTNGLKPREVPLGCQTLTAFVDVQQKLLYWVVCAWEDDFTGYVVDYGSYPDQQRWYFTLRDARRSLADVAAGTGLEGAIYAGLDSVCGDLLGREWRRDDGAELRIERCLVDANWGHSTDVVYQFCRQSEHAAVLTPSHGRFVGASSVPFSEYKRRQGDRVGLNWRVPNVRGKRSVRHVLYDTNYWKSFVQARLAVAMGDLGCLSLWGRDVERHRLFAEHVTAEYRVRTEGRGRTVDEWKLRPEQPDNHWLDGLVGCAVAASMQGCVLFGTESTAKPVRRRRLKLSEMKRDRT